ncbi:MAG TPA: hypothetical protein ENL38_01770 [Candidatus Aminicenantes bacterium]|nr:hypothetical protein [Candidatus Aminicenantes bacterium]
MKRKIIFTMDNGGSFAMELPEEEFDYLTKNEVVKIEVISNSSYKAIYENLDPTITVHVGEQEFKKPEFEGIMNRMGFTYKKDYDFKTHLTLYEAAKELKDKGIKTPNINEIKELRSKHLRPVALKENVADFLFNLRKGVIKTKI